MTVSSTPTEIRSGSGYPHIIWPWARYAFAAALCLIAFVFTYFYAATNPLSGRDFWYQHFMGPALNLACTGHLAPIKLSAEATPEDKAAYSDIDTFLHLRTADFSCSNFPAHVATADFLESSAFSNVEQPIYLMMVYGTLWRLFGVHWSLTAYLIAACAAISALLLFLCCVRFGHAALAAAASLAFVISPVFLQNSISPRDGLKFPFAVGISALLVTWATSPCLPRRLLLRAIVIGLSIGVGYGFRSDLYLFLAPAAVIFAFLSQPKLELSPARAWKKASAQLLVRGAAVCGLGISFAIGGFLPLVNNLYVHRNGRAEGYHVLAMGQYGITDGDLFLAPAYSGSIYGYRNAYNNDLGVGLRILEYAWRRDNVRPIFARDAYFSYAERYYREIVEKIPADIIAGGVGAFVNVMTFPVSLRHHTNIVNAFDRETPFSTAYEFIRSRWHDAPIGALDQIYHAVANIPLLYIFLINVGAVYFLLVRLVSRYGIGSAAAAVILLGAVLSVTSLKFEIRHVFYIFSFLLIAWVASIDGLVALLARASRIATDKLRGRVATRSLTPDRAALSCFTQAAAIAIAVTVSTLLALAAARTYQADKVRSWLAAWVSRPTVPVEYDLVPVRPGWSLIRIRSAMPVSAGGTQLSDAPPVADSTVRMSVVAIRLDGLRCDGKVVTLTSIGETNQPWPSTSYRLVEPFSIKLKGRSDFVSYIPAFGYAVPGTIASMYYRGTEIADENINCMKSVGVVTKYYHDDLLFDFAVPSDLSVLSRDNLFKRFYIPGFGLL